MSSADKRISALVIIVVLIHIIIFSVGLTIPVFSFLTALINLLGSASILIYWAQKQIRITQHFIELREIIVLGFEVFVFGCAVYALLIHRAIHWLSVVNSIILGIHLFALILLFVFMITFKMKKLF